MPVKKVLHVIPSIASWCGGPSLVLRSLTRDLSRAGIDTHVATTNDNGPDTLDVPRGVPVVDDGVTYWYFSRQTRFYTVSWPLGAWLARHVAEFDLVHIHALFAYPTLPAAFWAARREVPYVVRPLGTLNAWGMENRRPWLKKLSFAAIERRVLERAALVHYTSVPEQQEVERLRVRATPAVIPNPVAPIDSARLAGAFRRRYPQLADRRIVLFLSRIDPKKGVDLLIDAFAQLRRCHHSAVLVVVGSGAPSLIDRLQKRAGELGVANDVLWTGMLEGMERDAAFADADVFVLPSHSENFGNAAAEAMAAGLPVVVSDQVGIHADVTRTGAGLVVSRDTPAVATAIERVLSDPRLARRMGDAGNELVRREYSSAAVTRKLIAAYNAIVHRELDGLESAS